jgi:hypothetical protein
MRRTRSALRGVGAIVAGGALVLSTVSSAASAAPAASDSFYTYSGSTPLADLAPGTVLKTRTLPYHLLGIPLPLKVVQLLYRGTTQVGTASANTTSIIEPPVQLGPAKQVVAYQSFYDSLNPADSPSRTIAGDLSLGGLIPDVETALLVPELLQGRPVVVADTEGPDADFASGPSTAATPSTRCAPHSSRRPRG